MIARRPQCLLPGVAVSRCTTSSWSIKCISLHQWRLLEQAEDQRVEML
jgi:hypothetical protein